MLCAGLKTEDALAQFKWRKINIMSRRRERERFKEKKIKTNKNKSQLTFQHLTEIEHIIMLSIKGSLIPARDVCQVHPEIILSCKTVF